MKCFFCNRDGTKYSCILCCNPVCNVCAEEVDENEEGYDELNYQVGKCPDNKCAVMDVNKEILNSSEVDDVNNVYSSDLNNRDVNNVISDTMMVTVNNQTSIKKLKKRKVGNKMQGKPVDLLNFFRPSISTHSSALNEGEANKISTTEDIRDGNKKISSPPQKKKFEFNYTGKIKSKQENLEINEIAGNKYSDAADIILKTTDSKSRNVTIDTIEKRWKNDLASKDINIWLSYRNHGDYAVDLKCLVCTKFEHLIKSTKGFNKNWITGSHNYKVSNVRCHADSEPHKIAMRNYYKEEHMEQKDEKDANQLTLDTSFLAGDIRNNEQVKKKFEVAYFVAKEEMAFKKYPSILNLEEMHGVDIGCSYRNDKSCGEFIDSFGKNIKNVLSEEINKANFYSIFFDGATDESTKDQECFYILLFNHHPMEKGMRDKVEVGLRFLGLHDMKAKDGGATANGIKLGVDKCFEELGIRNYTEKLIGFCADGANVNRGEKTGVKALLREYCPWIIFIWCMSHRLELAVKESLKDTKFMMIDEMLLHLYYLYEKSPKKCSELEDLHKELNNVFEFENSSFKPLRSNGTRWISHKLSAIRRIIDKFGLYIRHLSDMAVDKSYKSEQRAKVKGFLDKWKKTSVLLNLCFYVEILLPVSKLSLALQEGDIDPVKAIDALVTINGKLLKLKEKPVDEYSTLSAIKRKSSSSGNDLIYQGVILQNFEQELSLLRSKQGREITAVKDVVNARLDEETSFLKPVARILNCEAWGGDLSGDDGDEDIDVEFVDKDVKKLFRHFNKPLVSAGVTLTENEFLDEWHDIFRYTKTYLNPSKFSYLKTWRRLFNSSRAETDFKAVLCLIEVCFVMPVSNAQIERLFSRMKRVKTRTRCSLSNKRLENLLRIGQEGEELNLTTVLPAMKVWENDKVRRPNHRNNDK